MTTAKKNQGPSAGYLFEQFAEREDWLGYGYLGLRDELGSTTTEYREYPGKPRVRDRVDRAVLRAARELGWTDEQLFHWANSKLGRWYAEDGGDFRRHSDAQRDLNQALESLKDFERVAEDEMPARWREAKGCADCGLQTDLDEDGLCDSCAQARRYDRVSGEPDDYLPADVRAAVDLLAEWGAANSRVADDPEARERLRCWIGGAVEAQVTDPDYESAEDTEFFDPAA